MMVSIPGTCMAAPRTWSIGATCALIRSTRLVLHQGSEIDAW